MSPSWARPAPSARRARRYWRARRRRSRWSGATWRVWKRWRRGCKRAATRRSRLYTDVAAGLKDADIIITVTSAVDAVILPEHIKPGAVVCDVARPRDVSVRVAKERDDVLVIEGGVVQVPGEMRLPKPGQARQRSSTFGFPPGTAYACMSETMMLALDDATRISRWAKRSRPRRWMRSTVWRETRLPPGRVPLLREGCGSGDHRAGAPERPQKSAKVIRLRNSGE